jgi:hypothetical protein
MSDIMNTKVSSASYNDNEFKGGRGNNSNIFWHTTRWLASGAYYNNSFRKFVLDEFSDWKANAIGPCYGVCASFVLEHCLRAEKLFFVRICIFFLISLIGIYGVIVSPEQNLVTWLVIWWIATASVFWYFKSSIEDIMLNVLTKKNVLDECSNRLAKNFTSINGKDHIFTDNLNIVYYAGYKPFVGTGVSSQSWSFVLDMTKPKIEEHPQSMPKPFTIDDLYQWLQSSFNELQDHRIIMTEIAYVAGYSIQFKFPFQTHPSVRPLQIIPQDDFAKIGQHPRSTCKVYKVLQVCDDIGEIFVSFIFRAHCLDKHIIFECNTNILPPLKKEFYKIDKICNVHSVYHFFSEVVVCAALGPLAAIADLGRGLYRIHKWFNSGRNDYFRSIENDPMFNYGSSQSIREFAASKEYHQLFEKLDTDLRIKFIQKRLLDLLEKFFDMHNIDVSDFRERQTAITNYGMIVSGGNIETRSLAVGNDARADTRAYNFRKLPLEKSGD